VLKGVHALGYDLGIEGVVGVLPYQATAQAGGAGGQMFPFQEYHLACAHASQMEGDAGSDDPAADDDCVCCSWKLHSKLLYPVTEWPRRLLGWLLEVSPCAWIAEPLSALKALIGDRLSVESAPEP
jgi:hypothetical protein